MFAKEKCENRRAVNSGEWIVAARENDPRHPRITMH